nr:hypothetical protein [Rhodococcus rhodochrous]
MSMPTLRHTPPDTRCFGQRIALDDDHSIEAVAERTGGQQTPYSGTDHYRSRVPDLGHGFSVLSQQGENHPSFGG